MVEETQNKYTLGEATVKSVYIQKYVNNIFKNTVSNIDLDIANKYLYSSNEQKTKKKIYRYIGKEKYQSLPFIFRQAYGIILMYDILGKIHSILLVLVGKDIGFLR